MSITVAVFWVFAGGLLLSSVYAVVARNTVHSVLSLLLAFFASSALWLLLQAEFLGLILLYVYIGAVMTLFLFVVMMLHLAPSARRAWLRYAPLGVLVVVAMATFMVMAVDSLDEPVVGAAMAQSLANKHNTLALGKVLYTQYVMPFELTGLLLLVAIVAAVALLHRKKRRSRSQDTEAQIHVDPTTRIRMVSMNVEKD